MVWTTGKRLGWRFSCQTPKMNGISKVTWSNLSILSLPSTVQLSLHSHPEDAIRYNNASHQCDPTPHRQRGLKTTDNSVSLDVRWSCSMTQWYSIMQLKSGSLWAPLFTKRIPGCCTPWLNNNDDDRLQSPLETHLVILRYRCLPFRKHRAVTSGITCGGLYKIHQMFGSFPFIWYVMNQNEDVRASYLRILIM